LNQYVSKKNLSLTAKIELSTITTMNQLCSNWSASNMATNVWRQKSIIR